MGLTPAEIVYRQHSTRASAPGDLVALRETFAADVARVEMADFPLGGADRTSSGVTSDAKERLAAEWYDCTVPDEAYAAEDDDVIALARYTTVNKATGHALDSSVAHQFVVRNEQDVRFEQFVDSATMRSAMLL